MLRNITYHILGNVQHQNKTHGSTSHTQVLLTDDTIFIVKCQVIILPSTPRSSKRFLLLSKSRCLSNNYKFQVLKKSFSIVTFEAKVLKVYSLIILNLLHVPPILPFPSSNHRKYIRTRNTIYESHYIIYFPSAVGNKFRSQHFAQHVFRKNFHFKRKSLRHQNEYKEKDIMCYKLCFLAFIIGRQATEFWRLIQ